MREGNAVKRKKASPNPIPIERLSFFFFPEGNLFQWRPKQFSYTVITLVSSIPETGIKLLFRDRSLFLVFCPALVFGMFSIFQSTGPSCLFTQKPESSQQRHSLTTRIKCHCKATSMFSQGMGWWWRKIRGQGKPVLCGTSQHWSSRSPCHTRAAFGASSGACPFRRCFPSPLLQHKEWAAAKKPTV